MKRFGLVLLSVAIGVLLATGIRSGVLFQFDQDELAHAQVSYLLVHGYIPYRQFLMTYTPVFHAFVSPVFLFAGYTMSAMTLTRWVMVAMFLLRTAVLGWVVQRVFGRRIAALFLLLFLIDPFTMYTTMQIRPDNLMMLLFTAGLAFLISGSFFWSGVLLATSGIILLKIAPSLAVIFLAMLWYGRDSLHYPNVKLFSLGFIFPVLLFFVYTAFTGTTHAMLQQVVGDSYAINLSVAFPIPIKHFYESGNSSLYDLYGDAWTRFPYFEQALLVLAAIGLVIALSAPRMIRWILAGSLIVQSILLLLVHSVFVQYFLPTTWLIDLFTAVALVACLRFLSRWRSLFFLFLTALLVSLLLFSYDSARANISRSRAVTNSTTEWLTSVWARIPQNAAVYPNIPFRPLVYPLMFGYYFHDLPPSVTSRLPPLVPALEQSRVPYILQTYEWKALPQDFPIYVSEKYHETDPGVFIRNE